MDPPTDDLNGASVVPRPARRGLVPHLPLLTAGTNITLDDPRWLNKQQPTGSVVAALEMDVQLRDDQVAHGTDLGWSILVVVLAQSVDARLGASTVPKK
jgi:hypothetical protein